MNRTSLLVTVVAIATLALASSAAAQGASEVGTRLAGSVTRLGDNKATAIGIPAASLGIGAPGAYITFRATPRVMVGPHANFYWSTSNGVSGHVLHATAQADYFLSNPSTSASFAFGSVGIVKSSFNDFTPLAFSGGFGRRIRVGDRLTFRIDGRLTRFTEGQGTTLGFGVSLGGLFGRR